MTTKQSDLILLTALNNSIEKYGKPCAHSTPLTTLCKGCFNELFEIIKSYSWPAYCVHAIPNTQECPLCKEEKSPPEAKESNE